MPDFENQCPCDLAGKGVLVTRPTAQAGPLCRLIEAAGGMAIRFPTLAIEPIANADSARRLLTQPWDLILFVSRNAVEQSIPLFPERRLPAGPRLGAVGMTTAKALTAAGRAPDLVPVDRFDSEGLLALPALSDLHGQSVLIVRGEGGRGLLGNTLIARGAKLAYAEAYRRTLPETDPAPLLARWHRDVQLVTATSTEVLNNLLALVGQTGRSVLLATPLVVVSERTARAAEDCGFARIELAERASDAAILAALCRIGNPPTRG